jgi:hydroxybutyrate-dimer hydrolase
VPGFGDRYVPLLPYGYAALDQMLRHVLDGTPLTPGAAPTASARGAAPLTASHLGLGIR